MLSGVYLLRALDQYGTPVDLAVEVCWRCGAPVVTSLVSMFEHAERMHPVLAREAEPVAEPMAEPMTEPFDVVGRHHLTP